MQLEDYFEFEKFDTKFGLMERIRIKGHRIALENVLEFFNEGMTPDVIQSELYPSLTLEEVYAAITYYLHNKQTVDAYMKRAEGVAEAFYREHQASEPNAVTKRLRELTAQIQGLDPSGQ